ncbi:MAG: xanthine dehydrogenase family protein subunit M [Burkholderiales bacterium]|nr:xanthine dehydrogenase family protein subunit M [Burkholderiales bacterium]
MQAIQLHQPASLADAAKLRSGNDDARFLAGGQSLLAAMKLGLNSATDLINLAALPDLAGIKVDGNRIVIGAMTRHADVAANADVKRLIPALAVLAGSIGDRQVRNVGTLGGSIANADPASDYPAAVVGLGATVRTNQREIAADAFFTGLYETALQNGEIITAVSFPVPEKAGYVKFKAPASRFALVGVFVSKGTGGVRVAVTGAAGSVFRAAGVEAALAGNWSAAAAKAVKLSADNLNSDLHATAEYRAHLIPVLASRAVTAAG